MALGVGGEIQFSRMGSRREKELAHRLKASLAEADKAAREAEARAEEARKRTAEIEQLTAFRRISHAQLEKIRTSLQGLKGCLDLLIEYQRDDTEAFVYARDLAAAFWDVAKVRVSPNSFLEVTPFGLFVTASSSISMEDISRAFTDARVEFSKMHRDLSTHLPRGVPAPNLYIFVGLKPPPPLVSPRIAPQQE